MRPQDREAPTGKCGMIVKSWVRPWLCLRTRSVESWWCCSDSDSDSDSGLLVGSDFDSDSGSDVTLPWPDQTISRYN